MAASTNTSSSRAEGCEIIDGGNSGYCVLIKGIFFLLDNYVAKFSAGLDLAPIQPRILIDLALEGMPASKVGLIAGSFATPPSFNFLEFSSCWSYSMP